MKILVLGSNSFISKEIKSFFFADNFLYVDRTTIDLEDKNSVNLFFKDKYFDIVINTCTLGGKRNIIDDFNVLNSNLSMFNNLLNNSKSFNKLFLFCSGAAFDRTKTIDNVKEKEIFDKNPKDYYGLSKNIIARESLKHDNLFVFRIFGCFGKHELETRFIKNSLNKIKNKNNILIEKNKYIDYISAEDLCLVLKYYIQNYNNNLYKDINLVYKEKQTLYDIANKIITFKKSHSRITIEKEAMDNSYTGDGSILSSLPINLYGFDKSLIRIIND